MRFIILLKNYTKGEEMDRTITKELIDRFSAFLIESERSNATISKYRHDLEVFTHFAK